MTAKVNRDQMLVVFDTIFEGCDTIVMTMPATRLVDEQPRHGFTFFTGVYGEPEFNIYSVDLVSGEDIEASFADTERKLAEWLHGHEIVAHVGMSLDAAIDMIRVIWPGKRAERLREGYATGGVAKKLH